MPIAKGAYDPYGKREQKTQFQFGGSGKSAYGVTGTWDEAPPVTSNFEQTVAAASRRLEGTSPTAAETAPAVTPGPADIEGWKRTYSDLIERALAAAAEAKAKKSAAQTPPKTAAQSPPPSKQPTPPKSTSAPKSPAPEWRQPYTPPSPPTIEPPAPPPPETITGPVPVEGVTPPETPAPETPRPQEPRGPGGFEREVPLPVGFSLPTPERLSEIWQEVMGRPATEEERRYFQTPQFLRVLTGRIPMWQAADPIWRRFFQLLGIIRNRVEE